MPAFNIFKVYPQQKQNLIELITSRGIVLTDSQVVTEEGKTYIYELYFTKEPLKNPVKWIKELQGLFNLGDYKADHYSAAVLISFDDLLYALSYGSSHFYISRFSDLDFGIELASRLIASFKTKSSREFSGAKAKAVETYHLLDDLSYEAGEAVDYIRGVPIDRQLWGKNISCGQSIQLRKRDFTIETIHRVCEKLEIALAGEILQEIPRLAQITKPESISELTEKLVSDISSGHYMINMTELQLSGVAFLFLDKYEFVIKINEDDIQIDETIDMEKLNKIVSTHFDGDYRKLLQANVEAQVDGVATYSKPFISFIDYIDNSSHCFLNEGKWHRFDTNYLSNIRAEVDKISLEFSREMNIFDEEQYVVWKSAQPVSQKHYRERYLNQLLEQSFGYVNRDRNFELFEGATVEVADLYRQDTIFIVKLGSPQKLNYAVDQAIAAVRVLERNEFNIQIDEIPFKVKKICLWLFIERQTDIVSLSELNSLIFLMKLAHWRKAVLLSGLIPEVRVSYKRLARSQSVKAV